MSKRRKHDRLISPGGILRILIISLLLVLAFPQPAHADVFIVDRFDDDLTALACTGADYDCSLRGAIIHANAIGGSDTIILGVGTYPLSDGDLDITDALTINGAGSSQTFIDGGGLDQVIEVMSGISLSLTDMTVQNGSRPTAVVSTTRPR